MKGVFTTFFILVFSFFIGKAQITISGKIVSSQDNKAIEFCRIQTFPNPLGTISNTEGEFNLILSKIPDSVKISQLGYTTLVISGSDAIKQHLFKLQPKAITLNEITVKDPDAYWWDIIDKSISVLKNQSQPIGRLYFILESNSNQNPVELLEAFYKRIYTYIKSFVIR